MERKAGILMHITSLPSKYGCGTLGKEAYKFVDFLKECGMKIWQVLPICPTSFGDSPYQSPSAFALNPYLIDYEILRKKHLIKREEYLYLYNTNKDKVDFSSLFNEKIEILKLAFNRFNYNIKDFKDLLLNDDICDYALFMTLKELNYYKPWYEWGDQYRGYSNILRDIITSKYKDKYLFWIWTQYELLEEWKNLKGYANKNGIQIMGDMPIYVAYDSVDVWRNRELFDLNPDGSLHYMAGCLGEGEDGEGGQLWGNPVYNWKYHKSTNYAWWDRRIKKALKLFDILRIDHFRGFDRYCALYPNNINSTKGIWLDGPSFDLFKDKLDYNIVAENLGFIDDGVRALMIKTGYLGMTVMMFGYTDDVNSEHLASNAPVKNIIYTGTHDNDTFFGHLKKLSRRELSIFRNALERDCSLLGVEYDSSRVSLRYMINKIIELGYASLSEIVIIQFQDLVYRNTTSRMNIPNVLSPNNWGYRAITSDFKKINREMYKNLALKYNRF